MDANRVLYSQTSCPSRWQRTTTTIQSRNYQRHSLDLAHWSALAGYAGEISAIPNVPSTSPRMGTLGEIARDTRSDCRGFGGSRQVQPHRMFHRRDLCGGEKGGSCVGKTKRGKGTKLMAVADGSGLPLAVHIASASPHEVTLVRETLQKRFLQSRPQRLIGDRAYDSDPLDRQLQQDGIEVISPHKVNRIRPKTQDGRPLRRYAKRWRIERLFAWMHNFRRLVVRYEYHAENFLGFVHLACIIILLRRGF
jgi:transposase